ncbi:MAG: hypothetical protein U0176_11570 [Bacteroidia bacterium]
MYSPMLAERHQRDRGGLVGGTAITLPVPPAHTIPYVRVKESANVWSDVFGTVVVRLNITTGTRPYNLVQAEYFWNNDPGVGNGTAMFATDGTINEVIEELFRNGVKNLSLGDHVFNVRVKDVDNQWSDVFRTLVNRHNVVTSTRDTKLIQAEYYWDTDPGAGIHGFPRRAMETNEMVEELPE